MSDDAKQSADPLSDGFRLAHWPFFHMNRAIRGYDAEMKRLLRSSGMDMPRWRILMIAREREPVSVSEVATLAIMELSTVTRAIQRLQQDGLLELNRRTTDQRVSEAVLTGEGREVAERVIKAASRIYRQAFAGFTADEVETLITLLGRVEAGLYDRV